MQREIGSTRGKRGFNWSLLRGLEQERLEVMAELGSYNSRRTSSRSRAGGEDFRAVYDL